MKYLSFLIKPASSLCNLSCRYCFYHDVSSFREKQNYGIMKDVVMESLIEKAFAAVDGEGTLAFAFQGGEPLLAGITYFRKFTAYVEKRRKKQKIYYSLQTNGTLLNDEWGQFFKTWDFLIGLSLDGYESNTNAFRIDKDGTGVYSQIMDGLAILQKYEIDYNVLSVITKRLSQHAEGFYSFMKKIDATYIQCIPCLGGLENSYDQELQPEQYLRFNSELFDVWYRDVKAGNYISISLFDQILQMLSDRPPVQCGMLGFCSPQMVVEANGNIYPCDFYVLDEWCCGNICTDSIRQIVENERMQRFLAEKSRMRKVCETCPFIGICHGGCKRQNRAYLKEEWCAYREFLFWAYPAMKELLRVK